MTLRWKSFERSLRPRVWAEVSASERLRQEYKRTRNFWGRHLAVPPWLTRTILLLLCVVMLGQASRPVSQVVAFIWLWALATAFLRAHQLNGALYFAPALNVFQHLPISDEQIFQTQWKNVFRRSMWTALDFSVLYGVLSYRTGSGLYCLATGAVLGVVQWLFLVAFGTCLFAWGPRRHAARFMLLFGGCALALFVFAQPAWLEWLNVFARWVPPLGWLPQAAGDNFSSGVARNLPPCVAWAVVLAAFPLAGRRIHREYVLSEAAFAAARRATATGEAAGSPWGDYVEHFIETPAAMATAIRGRTFMAGLDWPRAGVIERLIARLLTAREKTVAEFLVAANPNWTKGFRNALIMVVLLLVVPRLLAGRGEFGPTALIVMALYFAIGQTAGNWRGFTTVSLAGPQPPAYAFYPIGFRDLFVTILKINTARYALVLPLIAAGMVVMGGTLRASLDATEWWRLVALGFLAQPMLALTPISSASNDSSRFCFAVLAVVYIIAIVGVGCSFVFVQRPALILGSGLGLGVLVAGGVMLYARRFNCSRFDLVPQTKAG